ncbi:MAG: YfcE family phosphodiesterase [bacterium]
MKIGLISDTHGHQDLVEEAADVYASNNVDIIIHTGDVTTVKHIDALIELDCPLHLAFGNCDFNKTSFEQAEAHTTLECAGSGGVLNLDGRTIAFTHGHYDRTLNELLTENPDYLVHGHTHDRRDETISNTRVINPGAIKPPNPSFAILKLQEDKLNFHDLK